MTKSRSYANLSGKLGIGSLIRKKIELAYSKSQRQRARKFKKVQAKKTREIKIEILLDFHIIFWPILFPDFGFGQGI